MFWMGVLLLFAMLSGLWFWVVVVVVDAAVAAAVAAAVDAAVVA